MFLIRNARKIERIEAMQDTEKKIQSARYVLESIYPSRRMMEELKRLQKADQKEVHAPTLLDSSVVIRNDLKQ